MNNWFYEELSLIYKESDNYIHRVDVNPCKNCLRCCSVEARLGVKLIEYDYIERYLKNTYGEEATAQPFKDYINKKRNEKGDFLYNICPYYDIKNKRCNLYPARTMSCRLFPYYTTKEEAFFENCPLNSKAQLLTMENILEKLPFLKRYYYLANLYDNHVITKFRLF